MIKEVIIKALQCTCEALLKDGTPCGYTWISVATEKPESCRNRKCRSREWNGPKKRVQPTRIELPKPKRIQMEEDDDYAF